jgi:hypothetical protein
VAIGEHTIRGFGKYIESYAGFSSPEKLSLGMSSAPEVVDEKRTDLQWLNFATSGAVNTTDLKRLVRALENRVLATSSRYCIWLSLIINAN